MRLIVLVLICLADTALSIYFRKTRFDRSINDNIDNIDETIKKSSTFTDDQTLFTAYKNSQENACYLEKLSNDATENRQNSLQGEREKPRILYVPNETLTKLEAWRLAGGRIVDFCRGFNIYHLQENKPIPGDIIDPFLNEVPTDENDITTRRVADVVLVPLLSRAKREIMLENREKLNKIQETIRTRRQTQPYRGRFRGQTQSQYLNLGNDGQSEGKAEAEATQQSSRAVVAGNRGMGQAQSMSSGGSGCEDCSGYHPDYSVQVDQVPGKLQVQRPGKDGQYVSVPGGGYPGGLAPGTRPPGIGVQYPGGVIPGATRPGDAIPGGSTYPGGGQQPDGTYSVPGMYYISGSEIRRRYPGGVVPGTVQGTGTTGAEVQYPGGTITTGTGGPYPGGTTTGTGGPYPGGTTTGTGGQYPGGTTTGTGGPYPGGTTTGTGGPYPGGTTTGTGGQYSGGTTTGTGGPYPGGTVTGTGGPYLGGTTTGIGGQYPGGTITGTGGPYPGGTTTGTGGPYPGGTTTGTGGIYPGGVSTGPGTTGTGVGYPSGVPTGPGTTGGSVLYPGGVVPGSVPTGGAGMYPNVVSTGTATAGSGITYPGGVGTGVGTGTVSTDGGRHPPIYGQGPVTPGITVTYPHGVIPGTQQTGGGGTYPGGVVPGGVTPGVGGTYSGGTVTTGGGPPQAIRRPEEGYPTGVSYPPGAGGVTYPTGVVPRVTSSGGTATTYPITAGGTYPAGLPGTITPGGGIYPGNVLPTDGKTVPATGTYPNIATSAKSDVGTSVSYPRGDQYPQKQIPSGTDVSTGYNVPQTGALPPGVSRYITPGTVYPGSPLPGDGTSQVTYPNGGRYPPYPAGSGQTIGQYPPSGQTPGIPTVQYPSVQYQPGQYPNVNQYYPGGTSGQVAIPGQGVPTSGVQYPGGQYPGGSLEPSQYYQKPKDSSATSAEDDNADTQASSSVKQVDAGTEASASSQGKYGQGTAQSQVSGIYSGTASFSAQAGTSDINRSAQAEISGGKDGAASNAEGVAGRGKSQAQVQLNSDSGSTSTGAQSSGWNHGTNSQVQASSKGGMADAQANGEGSTSSQAQIGFQPYLKDDDKVERHSIPFRGGGTASAQSGTHRGQSQSQLQGTFQYGITYTGAAQAGSGSGAAGSRKPFNFNLTNPEIQRPKVPQKLNNIPKTDVTEEASTSSDLDFNRIQKQRQGLTGSSSSRQMVVTTAAKEKVETKVAKEQFADNLKVEEPVYNDNEYVDDYEDDYDSTAIQNPPTNLETSYAHKESESQHQSQTIQLGNANSHDVRVTQDSNAPREGDRLQPGQSLPGYKIPTGFRGRVMSVAGEETIAQGDGKSQSQTVALIPKERNTTGENKSPASESRSLHNNYARFTSNHASRSNDEYFSGRTRSSSNSFLTRDLEKTVRPSYYTVTNSVTGKIDGNRDSQKKYEHRYYTKSSTCGYFTFSCNIVYGSNGRTKICKPKVPTYPDGTPMKC